jgi:hypothetical protein
MRALDPTQIEIRFNNPTATQFGGYPLVAGYLKEVGLDSALAQHIKMSRGPLGFTAPELSRFLIDAKLLGAPRLMHLERLRLDPMLTTISGIDGLSSGKTMGVYLKSFEPGHLRSVDRLSTSLLHKEWQKRYRGRKRPDVILDFDSTTMTVYGKQEGADRGMSFRKKEKPGYQPKFAFIGGLGLMVHQRLEPQSTNLDKDFLPFLSETMVRVPKKARIVGIRGDGALYSQGLIKRFERRSWAYGISAARTVRLRTAMLEIPENAWVESYDEKARICEVARIRYKPKTWDKERTYIISRRLKKDADQGRLFKGEQYKYFAYVTNKKGSVVNQYRFCVERASLENFIKESKGPFDYSRLPCAETNANEAYLRHVQVAYNLALFFKWRFCPNGVNRWTIQTLRDRLLCICGNLRRAGNRWLLSLPDWWPYQTIFNRLKRNCQLRLQL